MDVFAEHGIAGIVGLLFNAIFGADYIVSLDGVNAPFMPLGWIQRNFKQLYIQVAYIVACSFYAFVVSALIAFVIDKIPGLKLRASEEAELLGMDDDQMGEFAYDYVEVRRDYLAWQPTHGDDSLDGERAGRRENVPQTQRHGIAQHSQMIEGKDPAESNGSSGSENGHGHTGIGGDRHGIAYENMEKVDRENKAK